MSGHSPASSATGSRVSSPLLQLHGQSSSVCRASRTRRTSLGLRPTEPAVTMVNWISLFWSTMNTARLAKPSSPSMPSSRMSSCLESAIIGNGRSRRSSWSLRQAWWTNSESPEKPRTWASRSANSSFSLPKAAISVGHTKVKSLGHANTIFHLPS
ncbi:hypothetical protein BU52_28255 [Streptomyces toyocaensis]|uniref:Uncharacterized protein n=1 Tax=Streptomyces toyocaensis TaxID=55952 RepID=A0A081XJZ6_STRTO|nr:hypothetical protein BU52_28255 [Streptomyces toyocaensis]